MTAKRSSARSSPRQILERLLGLLHLDLGHAARGVEHQDQVARQPLLRHLDLRRDQEHEVAVLGGDRLVQERRQADVLVAEAVEELEVLVEHRLVAFEVDRHFLVALAGDRDRVRRAVDVLDRRAAT